jgi:pimeloyl-ACP methyl ester carboxylesterase
VLPKLLDKRIVEGAGHFVPHEQPDAVASAVLDALGATK